MSHPQTIVRFAPSPTGALHIGSARTALFNYLFARNQGGKFLLRIEDTDRQRSTSEAIEAIFKSLRWLGLDWDEEPVYQFQRAHRHAEVARDLVAQGKAYLCYCTPEELEIMRLESSARGLPPRYDGRWRDRSTQEAPTDGQPVVRLKMPQEGETRIHDLVQGEVVVSNSQLDDMILLRSDGTPTYMLSVVVDDHDMGITHIIRGDDHLTNAFRQHQLYQACGWSVPEFAHIPLIHGEDGAKLSKRHGATSVESYIDLGFLPEAFCNYLLRLGWAHGDDEIIDRNQAIEWFSLSGIGRSAARFDLAKLLHLNFHSLRKISHTQLVQLVKPFLEKKIADRSNGIPSNHWQYLEKGMKGLKERAKTLVELSEQGLFYLIAPIHSFDELPRELQIHRPVLMELMEELKTLEDFSETTLEMAFRKFAQTRSLKLAELAKPLRWILTGSSVSPSLFEIVSVLGKIETLQRLQTALFSNER
jgi:glutamyl-tRNA synthetase